MMHQSDAVAALGFVEISSSDKYRQAVLHQFVQDGPEVAARDGIDAVRRFIQEEHAGMMQQRAHQRELLFHAARELARWTRPERLHAGHL